MKHSIIKNFGNWNTISLTNESAIAQTSISTVNEALDSAQDGKLGADQLGEIQTLLKKAGLYAGEPDKKIGPATAEALDAFRKKAGITDAKEFTYFHNVNGLKIGQATLDKLKAYAKDPNSLGGAPAAEPAKPAEAPKAAEPAKAGSPEAAKPAETGATAAKPAEPAKPASPDPKAIVDQITAKFAAKADWQPYKGKGGIFGNDNEKGAIQMFTDWFNRTIKPMIDQMPADNPNKEKFYALLPALTNGIDRKLNKVPVSYTGADGKEVTVTVNADF